MNYNVLHTINRYASDTGRITSRTYHRVREVIEGRQELHQWADVVITFDNINHAVASYLDCYRMAMGRKMSYMQGMRLYAYCNRKGL